MAASAAAEELRNVATTCVAWICSSSALRSASSTGRPGPRSVASPSSTTRRSPLRARSYTTRARATPAIMMGSASFAPPSASAEAKARLRGSADSARTRASRRSQWATRAPSVPRRLRAKVRVNLITSGKVEKT